MVIRAGIESQSQEDLEFLRRASPLPAILHMMPAFRSDHPPLRPSLCPPLTGPILPGEPLSQEGQVDHPMTLQISAGEPLLSHPHAELLVMDYRTANDDQRGRGTL